MPCNHSYLGSSQLGSLVSCLPLHWSMSNKGENCPQTINTECVIKSQTGSIINIELLSEKNIKKNVVSISGSSVAQCGAECVA